MDDDAIALLADLVAIDSVNPDLVPGASGETAIADYCAAWLAERGLEVHRLESRPGRPSVVGIARGSGGGQSLMFNGHYDTVTLAGYDGDPLAPRMADGKLHGRGSFDMKSGLAAAMATTTRAASQNLRGDVLVACVADEEHSSWGTQEVLTRFTADAAIVTEPSHLELTLAHKGFAWFEVTIIGRAAHGSRPDLGIDAIAKAGYFLVAIDELGQRLGGATPHPVLGCGSVHASLIGGGEEASSYPAECRITIERRTLPGETAVTVERELSDILDDLAGRIPGFAYRLERGLERRPFEAQRDHPIISILTAEATPVLGHPPAIRGEPFWTDCALIQDAGIPCLLFGADGGGAHAAEEWVTLDSVRQLTAILTGTVIAFCS
jgi:acetylornithine deacetylase